VDFIVNHDPGHIFRFAPLQGKTAKDLLPNKHLTELKTLILKENEKISLRSDAVIHVLILLGGYWKWGGWIMKLFPKLFRDWIYDQVGRRRYSLFGKRDSCRIPSPSEAQRFLP
jgi:predicted DCC family thiol-disulfide oxidoreductase YuxK